MNWKGISVIGIYFVVLLIATGPIVTTILQSNMLIAGLIILFVWVSPGYLAAHISKKHGVLNAAVSGVVITIFGIAASALLNIEGDVAGVINGLLVSTVLWFGLGAVIWHVQSWLKQRNT